MPDVELDLYGGYRGKFMEDFGYDVGVLRYQYPSNKLSPERQHHGNLWRADLRTRPR